MLSQQTYAYFVAGKRTIGMKSLWLQYHYGKLLYIFTNGAHLKFRVQVLLTTTINLINIPSRLH